MTKPKPIPPPLDEGEQAALGGASLDTPHAESGRATPEDAQRADATDRAAAAAAASAAAPPAPPPAPAKAPAGKGPRALISSSSGQFVARPNPTEPPDPTVDVVICNWYGQHEGKPAHIKHGTPIGDLPPALQDAIRATRGQQVGPLPPKAPPNPFTP